jgi:hypothetical protein
MTDQPVTFTITALELSEPLLPVPTEGRQHMLALARWQGKPIGWVSLASTDRQISVAELKAAISHQLEWPLIQHTLAGSNANPPASPPISVVICTRNRCWNEASAASRR